MAHEIRPFYRERKGEVTTRPQHLDSDPSRIEPPTSLIKEK